MHDPALIDTIAKAICDSDEDPGYWHAAAALEAANPGTYSETLRMYRANAEAALDAMPKPVHWGVFLHSRGEPSLWQAERIDVLLADTQAEALDSAHRRLEWDTNNTITVVALVPVGGDHE